MFLEIDRFSNLQRDPSGSLFLFELPIRKGNWVSRTIEDGSNASLAGHLRIPENRRDGVTREGGTQMRQLLITAGLTIGMIVSSSTAALAWPWK